MRKINVAGMLLGQTQPTTDVRGRMNNQFSVEEPSAFHQFLLQEEITEKDVVDDQLLDSEMFSLEEILAELTELPLDKLKELYEKLTEVISGKSDLLIDDKVEDLDLLSLLNINLDLVDLPDQKEIRNLYFNLHTELEELIDKLSAEESNDLQFSAAFTKTDISQVTATDETGEISAEKQFAQLFAQAESLLASLSKGEDISKVSPKILALLEKWTSLENKLNLQGNEKNLTDQPKSEEAKLWERLVSTFKSRNQMTESQRYHASAQITSKDISKWLQSGLNAQQTMETSSVTQQQANTTSLPMSKVEQYVIHINQTDNTEPASKQLIDQFQSAMKTSRFLAMNNGVNQLSIALRPDNLGEMMVRLTEVNGEMTLKIIVSSQTTRQMLESNVHQLKNMFSPHQVVIEEQEANIQETQKHHEEQSFNEHEEDHSQQSNKDDSKESESSFDTDFHELLMNEKV